MTDLKPKMMTVKEVSEALGVSEQLIKKRIREIFPDKMENGKTTYLNEFEVTSISTRIKQNSSITTYHDHDRLPMTEQEENNLIKNAVGILISREEMYKEEITSLKIELDKEKRWYSVKRVKNMGFLSDMKVHSIWRPLKAWCIQNGYQIRTIFDANYGDVKTYHADAWRAVYGVEFDRKELTK